MTDQAIQMQYYNDGGYNPCNWKDRDLGSTGDFRKRLRWQCLGACVHRVYRFRCSAPRPVALIGAVMIADTEQR